MKIDLNNYEAFFILYMDNELSAAEKEMVESFLEKNPDLQYEWQLLQDARLPLPGNLSFEPKASLYRSTEHNSMINEENFQDYLLSSIDKELSPAEQEALEAYMATHPAAKKEFELFRHTVAEPELISFPDKASLYREEKPAKLISINWKRIAVAASFLLAIGTTSYLLIKGSDPESGIATTTSPAVQPNAGNAVLPENRAVQPENLTAHDQTVADTHVEETPKAEVAETPQYASVSGKNSKESRVTDDYSVLNQVRPGDEEQISEPAYADNRYIAPVQTRPMNAENKGMAEFAKNINTDPVTPATASALDLSKEQTLDVSMLDEEPRNKSYRGLLRKATRVMERKANINATTEDDRLLIAGFAVKLN